MKAIAIAIGALAAAAAASASADVYYGSRAYYSPEPVLNQNLECWNPHAGHFEQVRPNERQDDLDKSNCRNIAPGYAYAPVPAAPAPAYYYDRSAGDECWNPHAGHFERVRPNERQDDLDFSRCRPVGYRYAYRYR